MAVIIQTVKNPQLATLRPHVTKPVKVEKKTYPIIEHVDSSRAIEIL
jgi:hypothetical protein